MTEDKTSPSKRRPDQLRAYVTRKELYSESASTYRWRFRLLIFGLLIALFGLLWRLADLAGAHRAFLLGQGNARTLRIVSTPAFRGMITDRSGQPLAISTPVDSVWVNPQELDLNGEQINTLAHLLKMAPGDLQTFVQKNAHKEFMYLKRGLNPAMGAQVKALGIEGVYLKREYRRYYPEGEMTAQVLGFTNVDDQGQEGLELAYNQWLSGVQGRKRVLKDRLGHIVAEINTLKEPRAGGNLQLSIDRRVQYLAYRDLQAGVEKYHAQAGTAIVLDIKTGEILAMVNYPSFNPNNRPATRDGRYRNRAVTDVFEPGSTIKTFGVVSALTSGKFKPSSLVDTSPGWMIVDGKRIEDEHNNGVVNMTTLLKLSSNVGMSKVTLSLPPNQLWQVLRAMGFGQVTDSGFPGESAGLLVKPNPWRPFVLATWSFGYGMAATPLQLAQAYAVLANDGVKQPISLLRREQPTTGTRVIDSRVAHQVLVMLESVISQGGTAPLARVHGYRVTGKTGTARILGTNGYQKDHHNGSFIGIAPASAPRLLVAVILNDIPGSNQLGGYTAGPIFSQIMGATLRLLNIPPDNLTALSMPAISAPPVSRGEDG